MTKGIDYFNTLDLLEPKCPGCKTKIEWGDSTEWSDEHNSQVCKNCGRVLN